MNKGFPRYIDELAQRCAGRVNYSAVFTGDEHVFTDKHGKPHDITLHSKRVMTVMEAFHEMLAASWGSLLGLPVAPTVFDYQRVPNPTKREKNGFAPFISSVQMHRHAVRVATVLEHAQQREKGKSYKNDDHDAEVWNSLMRDLDVPPLLDMERAIFHHAIKPFSQLAPFMEWIGGGDLNDTNQILEARKVLHLVHDHGDAQGNTLGFYLCDFSTNHLETYQIDDVDVLYDKTTTSVGAFSSMLEFYPSIRAAEAKLAKLAGEDDWYGIRRDYPGALIVPTFAPHLDFVAMRKTMAHIGELDDDIIRTETSRIATTMAGIITDKTLAAQLTDYADYFARALIARRDNLPVIMDHLLLHEANPHAHTYNPFEVFQEVIAEEAASIREARRSTRPRAIRSAKTQHAAKKDV